MKQPSSVHPGALDEAGWLAGARRQPSANADERPAGEAISLAVIHAISLPPDCFGGPGVEQLFCNRLDPAEHPYYEAIHALRVSAHFFIRRDGELLQFVPCGLRAWHAGLSRWGERERCNDFSVGIELEGCDTQAFAGAQYEVLADVLGALAQRYPLQAAVGHSHIAPGRKTDPGPCFDWQRLARVMDARGVAISLPDP